VYKRKNAIIHGATSRAFTVTFQSVGRDGSGNIDLSTDVYILVDDVQIAQITPVVNQFTDHSITFYQCKDTEKFTFTLKGDVSKDHWDRTGIANLKINGISVIDYYNYVTTNNTNAGVVNKSLSNTGTTGNPNPGAFRFNNLGTNPIVPSSSNPFIVVSGGDNTITNHYHTKEFSASLFPCIVVPNKTCSYIKSYKEGSDCCEKTVQTNTSLGALTQGDYIYQRISECTSFDLSYVQYNQTHSLPLNTCHSG
jgi:hypothetical protein